MGNILPLLLLRFLSYTEYINNIANLFIYVHFTNLITDQYGCVKNSKWRIIKVLNETICKLCV